MIRTATAFAGGIVCDVVLLLAAAPLVRYSFVAASAEHPNRGLILLLLAANVSLMLLCLCGLGAWSYALFQSFRATHARVVRETVAISRNRIVSRSTTPAN